MDTLKNMKFLRKLPTPEEIQHDPQVVKAYLGDRFRTEE